MMQGIGAILILIGIVMNLFNRRNPTSMAYLVAGLIVMLTGSYFGI